MIYFLKCSSDIDKFIKTHPILEDYKEKSYDESYFTLEDIEEIHNMEYNGNCPKLILSMGENVKE